jgi:hypothetical protein
MCNGAAVLFVVGNTSFSITNFDYFRASQRSRVIFIGNWQLLVVFCNYAIKYSSFFKDEEIIS